MRYHRRRWYGSSRGRRRSRATSDNHRSPPPYDQSLAFVRKEFFNLSECKFQDFVEYYASKYGDGPRSYLSRTYRTWRTGQTRMSRQTERRILECVPPFLDTDKQFQLLAFYIPPVIAQQRRQLDARHLSLSEMADHYVQIAQTLMSNEYELDWFVREVFSAEEIMEFFNVFRFTMIDGLRQSYHDVRNDLVALRKACAATDAAIDVEYQIALLDCPLEIDARPTSLPLSLDIAAPEPRLVTEFRQQYRQILLEHVVQSRATIRTGDIRQRIALSDVDAVIRQLQRTKSDQEYESTLAIEGRGGNFTVRFEKKNPLRLQYAIAVESVKLGIVATISAALAFWMFAKGLWPLLFYVAFIPLVILSAVWTKLQSLRSELKEYERKRRTGVATPRH